MDVPEGQLSFASPQKVSDVFIQVTPMIDVMMMLICFYLLVGQLISGEKDAGVQLPRMANPVAEAEKPAEIVLNLLADGKVTLNSQEVGLESVRGLLAVQVHNQGLAGPGANPLNVVIRADRRQRFARLDELLKACRQAGVRQVVFRSMQGEEP